MEAQKPIEKAWLGHRNILKYSDNKFYVVITDESFDITGAWEEIPERTEVAFGIINRLATRLIEDGIELEDLASLFWSESRTKSDLAGMLTTAVEMEVKQ